MFLLFLSVSWFVFATGVIKDPRDYAVFYNRTHWHAFSCHTMLRNCMCSYCSYHARMGWGGGWAWLHALSCHTCWMLQNCTYMFHATQLHVLVLFVSCADGVGGGVGGGVGVVACVVLSHMLDATELHIHVSCYATACARTVRIMHGWGGGWGGVGLVACVVLSHMLDATELHIHVSCYATACARTVRIMRWWGGGWGGGWLYSTCWRQQSLEIRV